jgi:hypothetical protein
MKETGQSEGAGLSGLMNRTVRFRREVQETSLLCASFLSCAMFLKVCNAKTRS